jgi:hypothetical protein
MPRSSIDPETLSQALNLICQAEGIAADHVEAVRLVDDDEIEVKVAHPSGRSRLLVYPLAALRGVRSSAVQPDDAPPDAVSKAAQSKR